MSLIFNRLLQSAAFFSMGFTTLSWAQELKIAVPNSLQRFGPAIEQVISSAGFSPSVVSYPPARASKMFKDGDVDAIFPRTKDAIKTIASDALLVGPIGCIEGVMFARKDKSIEISRLTESRHYKVGVLSNHLAGAEYARKSNLDVEIVHQPESLYRMLDAGRFGVALDTRQNGLAILGLQKLDGVISQVGPVLYFEPVFLGVNENRRDWIPRLQKAFNTAIDNRTWQDVVGGINIAAGVPENLGLTCLKSKAVR